MDAEDVLLAIKRAYGYGCFDDTRKAFEGLGKDCIASLRRSGGYGQFSE